MSETDKLDPEKIRQSLMGNHFIKRIHVVDQVESTHTELKNWVDDKACQSGVLLAAETQSQGKGRMGRQWTSTPYQSLTFSFLCPNCFPRRPGKITIGLAIAAAKAIESKTSIPIGIKWPNDLYVEFKKLGGVLAQTINPSLTLAGLGLNVNAAPRSQAKDPSFNPICLKDKTHHNLNRNALLAAILNEFNGMLDSFSGGESDFLIQELRNRSVLKGLHTTFEWNNKQFSGILMDHTENLEILLQTEQGLISLPGETADLLSFQRP